jgi:hypothetical protein
VTGAPSPAQIADLLAWARRLTEAGTGGDRAERAAYLAAKTELLARISAQRPHTDEHLHTDEHSHIDEDAP